MTPSRMDSKKIPPSQTERFPVKQILYDRKELETLIEKNMSKLEEASEQLQTMDSEKLRQQQKLKMESLIRNIKSLKAKLEERGE